MTWRPPIATKQVQNAPTRELRDRGLTWFDAGELRQLGGVAGITIVSLNQSR